MYELFFEFEVGICERFSALSPFEIRRTRANEVFLLMRRLDEYNRRQKKNTRNGKPVVRKPAGDNWF